MKEPSLIFTMALPSGSVDREIEGLLQLMDGTKELNAYRASSSRANHQYWGSWRRKGGLIPPDEPWVVATSPINMPNIPGVAGLFYPLTPFEIQTIGDTRGDFGLHADANRANSPGTLGCLFPATKAGWTAINRDLAIALANGFTSLPLQVHYTQL